MAKVDIYLPDELYARAKEQDLPLSALAQVLAACPAAPAGRTNCRRV